MLPPAAALAFGAGDRAVVSERVWLTGLEEHPQNRPCPHIGRRAYQGVAYRAVQRETVGWGPSWEGRMRAMSTAG